MMHDPSIHALLHSLMDAHSKAYVFYTEIASTDEDIEYAKKIMKASKDGASHLLNGTIKKAKECLKEALENSS